MCTVCPDQIRVINISSPVTLCHVWNLELPPSVCPWSMCWVTMNHSHCSVCVVLGPCSYLFLLCCRLSKLPSLLSLTASGYHYSEFRLSLERFFFFKIEVRLGRTGKFPLGMLGACLCVVELKAHDRWMPWTCSDLPCTRVPLTVVIRAWDLSLFLLRLPNVSHEAILPWLTRLFWWIVVIREQ